MADNHNNDENHAQESIKLNHKLYAYKSIAITFALYLISGIILSVFSKAYLPEGQQNIFNIYSQGVIQLLLLYLPAIYFSKRAFLDYNILLRKINYPNSRQVIAGICGIFAFQFFVAGYMVIQKAIIPHSLIQNYLDLEKMIEEMYATLFTGSDSLALIRGLTIGALIPAFSEETLFRGFFQRSLEANMSAFRAILITSLIFTILHFNPIGFFPLLIIGIYLGFTAWSTDSLILPMIIHFINNAFALIIIFSPKLTEIEDKSSEIPILSAIMIFVAGLVFLIYCCYFIYKESLINKTKILHQVEA